MNTKSLAKITLLALGLSFMTTHGFAKDKLVIPSKPQRRAPLFIALHGCMTDASEAERTTRMTEFGEKNGFYVYYPEPELGSDSQGCFNFYMPEAQSPGGGDAAAIIRKVDDLLKRYDIDERKIYLLGMSAGGSLISVLTSCYPDYFAGAAIHSGMGYGLVSDWQEGLRTASLGPNPTRPRNLTCLPTNYQGKIFLAQGSNDPVMNPRHFSALKKDYLQGTSKKVERIRNSVHRLGYRREYFYKNGSMVGQTLYVVGMNHDWSGSQPLNFFSPRGPDVSQMIVDFFLNEE
ncbi:MAG: hypothetical protein RJB66_1813 [Pseudomonadota bacterium]|jgi:poly(hydroxyalkanoate) depolymerase family esterase